MQPEELEALHHVPFNPSRQSTKTSFSGFVKYSFPVLGKALVFASAMLRQHVVSSKTYMAELACHRGCGDSLAPTPQAVKRHCRRNAEASTAMPSVHARHFLVQFRYQGHTVSNPNTNEPNRFWA